MTRHEDEVGEDLLMGWFVDVLTLRADRRHDEALDIGSKALAFIREERERLILRDLERGQKVTVVYQSPRLAEKVAG